MENGDHQEDIIEIDLEGFNANEAEADPAVDRSVLDIEATHGPNDLARLNADKFLLTYSRCPAPKQTIAEALIRQLDTPRNRIKLCVASEEHHQDGGLHVHVVLEFSKRRDVNPATSFDLRLRDGRGQEVAFHPNVKALKGAHGSLTTTAATIDNVLEYITKEDENPYVYGCNVEDIFARVERSKKNRKERLTKRKADGLFQQVAKKIQAGADIFTISNEQPGFIMQNLNKVQLFKQFHEQQLHTLKPRPEYFRIAGIDIPLQPNARQKRIHLFLYSKIPSMGKTTWFKEILQHDNITICSKAIKEQKWPSAAQHSNLLMIDAISIDEGNNLRGNWTQIENICQGILTCGVYRENLDLPRRTLIITSNRTPTEVFGFGCPCTTRQERDGCSQCQFKKIVAMRFHFVHVTRNMYMHDHNYPFPIGEELNEFQEEVDIENIE
jgi:hypothetical protein